MTVRGVGVYEIDKLMNEARRLAAEYRRATGKTLAISGEIAISDAIHLLGLEPAPADAPPCHAKNEMEKQTKTARMIEMRIAGWARIWANFGRCANWELLVPLIEYNS